AREDQIRGAAQRLDCQDTGVEQVGRSFLELLKRRGGYSAGSAEVDTPQAAQRWILRRQAWKLAPLLQRWTSRQPPWLLQLRRTGRLLWWRVPGRPAPPRR